MRLIHYDGLRERGIRYSRVHNIGIPIDMALRERIERHKAAILQGLITEFDARFGVFKADVFNLRLFRKWLQRQGIEWLYLDSGMPSTRDEIFKDDLANAAAGALVMAQIGTPDQQWLREWKKKQKEALERRARSLV